MRLTIKRAASSPHGSGEGPPGDDGAGSGRVVDLTALEEQAPPRRELRDDEVVGLAADLLMAQRTGDEQVFLTAMNQAADRVSDLLVSMAAIANRSLDAALGPDAAAHLVEQQAAASPRPERVRGPGADDDEDRHGAWRDAVAMAEAVADQRPDDALRLMIDAPDQMLLFRRFVQMVALLAPAVPPQTLLDTVDRVRGELPPLL